MKPPNPSNFPTAVEDMAGLADELSELGGGAGDEADRRNQYKVVRADGLLVVPAGVEGRLAGHAWLSAMRYA